MGTCVIKGCNLSRIGPPILWETMVFGYDLRVSLDEKQWRYTSLEDAQNGHQGIVDALRKTLAMIPKGN